MEEASTPAPSLVFKKRNCLNLAHPFHNFVHLIKVVVDGGQQRNTSQQALGNCLPNSPLSARLFPDESRWVRTTMASASRSPAFFPLFLLHATSTPG
jgi:hypothetical protein